MLVYCYWTKAGHYTIQAYNKPEVAADDVLSIIGEYIRVDAKPKKKPLRGLDAPPVFEAINFNDVVLNAPQDPPQPIVMGEEQNDNPRPKPVVKAEPEPSDELITLQKHLELSKSNKSLDNAIKAISLYEDYQKYIKCSPAILHTLIDVPVVEDYTPVPVPVPAVRFRPAAANPAINIQFAQPVNPAGIAIDE